MKRKAAIESEVEKTLTSLEGLQKASPAPFFYTRLQARLRAPRAGLWEQAVAFVARPVIAVAVVAMVLLVNSLAALKEESKVKVTRTEQQVSEEFPGAVATLYDYETEQP